jgi:hypothetical protein
MAKESNSKHKIEFTEGSLRFRIHKSISRGQKPQELPPLPTLNHLKTSLYCGSPRIEQGTTSSIDTHKQGNNKEPQTTSSINTHKQGNNLGLFNCLSRRRVV